MLQVSKCLWDAGVATEFVKNRKETLKAQIISVAQKGIPLMIIVGEKELATGCVVVKDIAAKTQTAVPLLDLASFATEFFKRTF